jgi:hypothetical protein
MVTGDLKYYNKIDEKVYVLNAALGTEYYPSEHFAIRAGLYSDMSNAQTVKSDAVHEVDHFDIYGATLSGTWFSGRTSLSLGIGYGFGSGDAQVFSDSLRVYDVDYSNLNVHISTSFSY